MSMSEFSQLQDEIAEHSASEPDPPYAIRRGRSRRTYECMTCGEKFRSRVLFDEEPPYCTKCESALNIHYAQEFTEDTKEAIGRGNVSSARYSAKWAARLVMPNTNARRRRIYEDFGPAWGCRGGF